MDYTRRTFLRRSAEGLAIIGGSSVLLPTWASPTQGSGTLGAYRDYLRQENAQTPEHPKGAWALTEDNILGPFYRTGAPYRAKITPPLEPGTVVLIAGRVWGYDTRKPLAGAVIDIWQANAKGRYDNDDPANPPAPGVFRNRARVSTDERGYYEYETVHPGPYQTDVNVWRPSHIHYLVRKPGYRTLVTQLYFAGDPYNATDPYIKKSLIIETAKKTVDGGSYEEGRFDIVLAPE